MKITIEHLEFPLNVKDKITKIPKISKLHLDFISGKNIHFDKTNLSIKEPHKIIISNESSCLILISYEHDNNLYVKDSLEIMTLSRLSDLVLKMWKMKKIKIFLNLFFPLFIRVKQQFWDIIFKNVPLRVLKKCGIMVIYDNCR